MSDSIYLVEKGLRRGPYISPYVMNGFDVKTVICLEEPPKHLLEGEYCEQIAHERYGIYIIHYPLSALCFPDIVDFQIANDLITKSLKLGGVYVHCRYGLDRTGIVCAYRRVVTHGWTIRAALAEMNSIGFTWSHFWWPSSFRRMLAGKYI